MDKSANQLWRESGTTLSFKDWIEREKEKGNFILNKKVQDTLASMKSNLLTKFDDTKDKDLGLGENPKAKSNFIGLSNVAIGFSIVIIVAGIAYSVYQKRK
jgi:hypothetical protein